METNLRKFSMSVALPIISCLHLGQMQRLNGDVDNILKKFKLSQRLVELLIKPFLEICEVRDIDSNF